MPVDNVDFLNANGQQYIGGVQKPGTLSSADRGALQLRAEPVSCRAGHAPNG
ncbi:MAG: hypothetical protein QOI76_2901 [Frankiales bacterium]|nr:hypothetical protein [Frankiales bacterium]